MIANKTNMAGNIAWPMVIKIHLKLTGYGKQYSNQDLNHLKKHHSSLISDKIKPRQLICIVNKLNRFIDFKK